jgi:RNA polymerase sigma factor (sigma-70 family)
MIKNIKFSDKIIKYNTETQDGFEEILHIFDRKIRTTVSSWVKNIPDHDIDDLAQVCRMKLVEALEKYNDKSNINFTTFVYTVWKRKLSQLSYKYKTKKHSSYIEGDRYASFNYALDKLTNSFYLMLGKHKCPISRQVINEKTCHGCQHHCGYDQKLVNKGIYNGQVKNFTKCSYLNKILAKRGVVNYSIHEPLNVDGFKSSSTSQKNYTIQNILADSRNDADRLEKDIDMRRIFSNLDDESFIILQLIVEGFSRAEIIKKLNTTNSRLKNSFKKLRSDERLKEIILEVCR